MSEEAMGDIYVCHAPHFRSSTLDAFITQKVISQKDNTAKKTQRIESPRTYFISKQAKCWMIKERVAKNDEG